MGIAGIVVGLGVVINLAIGAVVFPELVIRILIIVVVVLVVTVNIVVGVMIVIMFMLLLFVPMPPPRATPRSESSPAGWHECGA